MALGRRTVVVLLTRGTKPIRKIKAAPLFDTVGTRLPGVIESVHAAKLTKAAVEFFGAARARRALPLTTDLHGRAMLIGKTALSAFATLRVAVDTKAGRAV